ncbi:hypothetical protein FA15DRAFT_96594 [Coprinopsis marcescibilis]|uniref:Nephrocystin 3-like N-terminal domain-containing protein n=1 Tax=Coprinopsis marcescibilis TaxID=230819 RepID=A0A5C3KYS6_COPMA|nr:hypothetical protein FA15DRAFT_96594 [Coprinopsis marcescibilis]
MLTINGWDYLDGGSEIDEALRGLRKPKGCAWDPDRTCLPGTRVLHIEEITSWAAKLEGGDPDPGAHILIVPGPAGSGKSALAHTICRETERKGILVCSIFFDQRGEPLTADNFMAAFIQGLCGVGIEVKKAIAQLVIENPTLASASATRQFEDIIMRVLSLLPAERTFVVGIDALDEQLDGSILPFLRDHVPRLPSSFRFVLTTRPDPRVMRDLENQRHIITFPRSLIGDSTEEDIKAFATSWLSTKSYYDTISPELLASFIVKSEGLFLWAQTVLNHIDGSYEPAAELADIVKGASSHWTEAKTAAGKLEALYERILSKLEWTDWRFVEKYTMVMGALVTLQEPLSAAGIAALYEPKGIAVVHIHKICTLVRPLLQNYHKDDSKQPIRLLHLSVQEWLATRASAPYRLNCQDHHSILAKLSLAAIKKDLRPFNVPFLGYTGGDWVWNVAKDAPKIPVLLKDAVHEKLWYSLRFCDSHVLALSREEIDAEHAALLRDTVVENPAPILEAIISTGSLTELVSLGNIALEHCCPDDQLGAKARLTAQVYCSVGRCLYADQRKLESFPLFEEAVKTYRQDVLDDDAAVGLELAVCLNHLASQFKEWDRSGEALSNIEEALCISRQLVLTDLDNNNCQHLLANSLAVKALILRRLGRDEESYQMGVEVMELDRQLSTTRPGKYQFQLALALLTLASTLKFRNRLEDAIKFSHEAITTFRRLAVLYPSPETQHHLPDSLAKHAEYLREAGRTGEGAEMKEEVVEIRRGLVNKYRGSSKWFLAKALEDLVKYLDQCGRLADAMPFSQEEVDIRRELVKDSEEGSDGYCHGQQNLADSLRRHATYLCKMGMPAEAHEMEHEVVKIRHRLWLDYQSSQEFNEALLVALADWTTSLAARGSAVESMPLYRELVEYHRRLTVQDPKVHRPLLAFSLQCYAWNLSKIPGREQESVKMVGEAVETYRRLAVPDPTTSNQDYELANSIENSFSGHAARLQQMGISAEAPETIQHEVVEIRRRIWRTDPSSQQFNANLWWSLSNWTTSLVACGRPSDSIPIYQELVQVHRKCAGQDPRVYEPLLASSLNEYAWNLAKLPGYEQESVTIGQEAVEARRRVVASDPTATALEVDLANTLDTLAYSLNLCKKYAESLQIVLEGLEICNRVNTNVPGSCTDHFFGFLHTRHAETLVGLGREDEAVVPVQEAITIYRRLLDKFPWSSEYQLDMQSCTSLLEKISGGRAGIIIKV